MRHRVGWVRDRPWLIALVVFVAVVIPGFVRVEQINNRTDDLVGCISDWAREVTARSSELSTARGTLDDANDDLWRTFATLLAAPPADARQQFQHKLDVYVQASDHYRTVVKDHPVPPSPQVRC